MRKTKATGSEEAPVVEEQKVVKKTTRTHKKAVATATPAEPVEVVAETEAEAPKSEVVAQETAPAAEQKQPEAPAKKKEAPAVKETEEIAEPVKAEPVKKTSIPALPRNLVVRDIVDLLAVRIPMLNDQQVQQLTLQEARERHLFFEAILAQVLDYDIVLSDTNIWLELLVGHTSSHSDPKVNARLMFERQLEFISKLMKKKGGRFMIMSETYEEIDRFATQQDPTNYNQADFTDEAVCRNIAARLAKRLILSQQRENRLRIEGICSESHHAAFADPAIIRRTVDLFAAGKKILLLTNDASVAIRSLGMCDDLQRINKIDDATWDKVYAPIRPMACTMDDLKQLDSYTRQYHFLMQAAGAGWMQDVVPQAAREELQPLQIDENLFRPGDKHERRSDRQAQERRENERKEQERLQNERKQAQADIQRAQQEMQKLKAEQQKLEQQRKAEEQRIAQQQRAEEQRKANEQKRAEEQKRREEQRKAHEQKRAEQKAAEAPVEALSVAEEAPVAASAPVAQPIEAPVAKAPETIEEPAAEPTSSAEAQPVELPAFSAEDMELISSPAKKRTHRGGRRRGGSKSSAPQA